VNGKPNPWRFKFGEFEHLISLWVGILSFETCNIGIFDYVVSIEKIIASCPCQSHELKKDVAIFLPVKIKNVFCIY